MVTCGHQFHMGDECDWLISSSAVCPINGNSYAAQILKKLVEAHCETRIEEPQNAFGEVREIKNDLNKLDLSFYIQSGDGRLAPDTKRMPELVLEAREISLALPRNRKQQTGEQSRSGCDTPVYYDSEEFDENQHLDGCPIKWYYRKRTKNGWGPCVALKRTKEDNSRSEKRFRDRIPLEVKIGKISLNKREPFSDFRNFNGSKKQDSQSQAAKYKTYEIDPKVMEMQKRRLAVKLNWRPFQETNDQNESELSYDKSLRDGYLRPRSVLGGKSPVSILLFPYHQQGNCSCSGRVSVRRAQKVRKPRVSSAFNNEKPSSVSDVVRPSKMSRPKTTQSLRWGTKTQKGKRLQLPKQTNVLFDAPNKLSPKHSAGLPGLKKQNEKGRTGRRGHDEHMKNGQSLTSLYYELEDKSNSGKMVDDEYLEKMIRELSMEDNLRGIRNILNPGFTVKKKICKDDGPPEECQNSLRGGSNGDHFKVICHKVKFSERAPKFVKSSDAEQSSPATIAKDGTRHGFNGPEL